MPRTMTRHALRRYAVASAVVAATLVLAACGGGDDADAVADDAFAPVTAAVGSTPEPASPAPSSPAPSSPVQPSPVQASPAPASPAPGASAAASPAPASPSPSGAGDAAVAPGTGTTVTPAPVPALVDTQAELEVEDQRGDGRSVRIEQARTSRGSGHVAVFTGTTLLGSAAVTSGSQPVSIPLSTAVVGSGELVAVLYGDDGDGTFDPTGDPLILDEDGEREDEDFDYRVS
ncbi:DUF7282 domain-containing protein [Motilibacter deserti]|uniref:DUF7282 domain-containing protein n=1 Tax=Motilibacter deserti TaxID=2714956 RepID=A0ABX0H379_9ACTN|nr:hypothetical protein [Motilibacter deserti]NHC16410.1 hypothetical protein [Motilibacter deserti]